MNAEAILDRILARAGIARPDGRPLYAYRAKADELKELARGLRSNSTAELTTECAALALVAAEALCRGCGGGVWSWAPLWDEIGGVREMQQWLYPCLERGLRWWRLTLVRTDLSRRFLTTVVLQGGLPRQLLAAGAEGGAIGNFLQRLLSEYERFPTLDPVELARHHDSCLPRTLRRAELHQLCAEIVRSVASLRREIGIDLDAVAVLDRRIPSWRDRLPIHFDGDSDVAERLVAGLLASDCDVATESESPALEFVLDESATPPFRRRLRLPATIPCDSLWPPAHGESPPVLTLLLRSERSVERFVGEAFRVSGSDPIYRLESVPATPIAANDDLLGEWSLVASAPGRQPVGVALRNGESLRDLPWVFELPTSEDPFGALVATGSGHVQTDVLVALPCEARLLAGDWQRYDRVDSLRRELFMLCGDGEAEIDGECYRWRRSVTREDEYMLAGNLSPIALPRGIAWRGIPKLRARSNPESHFADVDERELSWRPGVTNFAWKQLDQALGTGVIRRQRDGETVYRTQLTILPRDLAWEVISDGSRGRLHLSSQELETLDVAPRADLTTAIDKRDHGFTILVGRRGDAALGDASLELRLGFGLGRTALVLAPVPVSLQSFVDAQGTPTRSKRVGLDLIRRLRALVVGGRHRPVPIVEASLAHRPSAVFATRPLLDSVPGRRELRLDAFLTQISELLALDDAAERDRAVRLRLVVENREAIRLDVEAFNASIVAERRPDGCPDRSPILRVRSIDDESPPINGYSCQLVPTWRPHAAPVLLKETAAGFSVPEHFLHPGWWVAVALDNETQAHARPLEFPVFESIAGHKPNEQFAPANDLERACASARIELDDSIDVAIQRIASNPIGPDWDGLVESAGTVARLPADTFRINRRLVHNPRAIAMVAMAQNDALARRAVWRRFEELPFLWASVPLAAWRAAVDALCFPHSPALRSRIAKSYLEELCSRGRASHPWLHSVAWCVGLAFGLEDVAHATDNHAHHRDAAGDAARRDVRFDVRAHVETPHSAAGLEYLDGLHMELRRRHADDDQTDCVSWPSFNPWRFAKSRGVERLYEQLQLPAQRSDTGAVVNGPTLAATCFATQTEPDAELVFALKQLRAFDREWFDQALLIQLPRAVGLSRDRSFRE